MQRCNHVRVDFYTHARTHMCIRHPTLPLVRSMPGRAGSMCKVYLRSMRILVWDIWWVHIRRVHAYGRTHHISHTHGRALYEPTIYPIRVYAYCVDTPYTYSQPCPACCALMCVCTRPRARVYRRNLRSRRRSCSSRLENLSRLQKRTVDVRTWQVSPLPPPPPPPFSLSMQG
jgi:hypothetical protein